MADTGADTRVAYLFEDNGFASSPNDSDHKPFGSDASMDTFEGNNQVRQVLEPGNKQPIDSLVQLFDGRWSVTFNMVNPWWMELVFGGPGSPTDNGDGTYTYSYAGTSPTSFRIKEGYTNSGDTREAMGCVVSNVRIAPSVNDNVRVTLDGPYAEEESNSPGVGSLFSQPSFQSEMSTMTFAQARVDLDGSEKSRVQDATLQVPLNVEMVGELNSRHPVDFYTRVYRPRVDIREIKSGGGIDDLEKFYGGATTMQERVTNKLSMTFLFTNGVAAGSGMNKMEFSLSGTLSDTFSENGVGNPEQPIEEQINRTVESVSATATNETNEAGAPT